MPDEVVQNTEAPVAPPEGQTNPDPGLDVNLPAEPEGQPAAQEQPQEAGAPEQYEDFTNEAGEKYLTADEMKDFAAVAKELNLSQEKAQRLLSSMLPAMKNRIQQSVSALPKQWAQQIRVDPELGGEALQENLGMANRAFKQFATPEFIKFLKGSGLSSHPEVVRVFYRIGKSMSPDMGVTGQGSPQPKRRMFPNSNMAI